MAARPLCNTHKDGSVGAGPTQTPLAVMKPWGFLRNQAGLVGANTAVYGSCMGIPWLVRGWGLAKGQVGRPVP
jgi:hypothetical protein